MAKVFQILVPDDKLVSRIISSENLVTELFVIDRADKDFVSEWEKELKKPALYILINRDTKELYIGETDNSYKRLKNHEAKDFWTEAIVFHSTTSTLSTTEVKWLEAKTFEELKMLDSYRLIHNKQTPKFPKLKRNQIYTLMPVFEEAKNYICAAGFDIFLRNTKRYSYEVESSGDSFVQSPIHENAREEFNKPYLSDQGKISIYFGCVKGKFIRETLKGLGMSENIFDITDLNVLEDLRKVVAKKEKAQGRHNTCACSISQLKHYIEKGFTYKEFEHDAMLVKNRKKETDDKR